MPCILVAHNCKSFDARFLVQAAEKNGVMDDLAKTVSGFTDSLPAFRELLPERKSHSQENLVQDLLCKSYEAHNALADVQTLYQLVNKFLNVKLLQKHSFKVSWVASYQKILKEKKLLVNTLQPLWQVSVQTQVWVYNTYKWCTKEASKKGWSKFWWRGLITNPESLQTSGCWHKYVSTL